MNQHTVIPSVFLVTGFLGSGKTRFLQQLLESPVAGSRNAVIVNDFGDAVYDSFLLKKHAVNLLELPGGCLCCSALDDFREALTRVTEYSPEHIFIEATGLADAAAVRADLGFMGFPVDAVFCVVDALHWRQSQQQFPMFDEQIREADYLLISKTDLVGNEDIAHLQEHLASVNNRAGVICLRRGRMDAESLLAALAPAEHFTPRQRNAPTHLIENPVSVFRLVFSSPVRTDVLLRSLRRLPSGAVRLKGRVRIQEHEKDEVTEKLLNFVNGRCELLPVTENAGSANRKSTLFLIGFSLAPETVTQAFSDIAGYSLQQGDLVHDSSIQHTHS
jgi:G3E family GTPase